MAITTAKFEERENFLVSPFPLAPHASTGFDFKQNLHSADSSE